MDGGLRSLENCLDMLYCFAAFLISQLRCHRGIVVAIQFAAMHFTEPRIVVERLGPCLKIMKLNWLYSDFPNLLLPRFWVLHRPEI
jgi:hypothetical protein